MSKTQYRTIKPKSDDGFKNTPIKTSDGLFLSALHPKYLHTNSTSHTWPFSAIAELIDNAYDPDANASQLFIDLKTLKGQHQVLVFTDNGNGMVPDKIYKMLSFGFCEKTAVNDHLPVGHYGNGFKSGSMRLGKDALVFTKTETRWSLGFLSQTYLTETKADTIIVPIVTWDPKKFTLIDDETASKKSLAAILEYSVINTVSDLKEEFKAIKGTSGTRIVISNLRKRSSGNKLELDLSSDSTDIRIPDDLADSDESKYKREQRQDHIPASDYSLKAYCSILFLKPRMQIILRGSKVKTTVVAKSLAKTEVDLYKTSTPTGYGKSVKIVFGFSQNKNHYGIMMYHRNRLIKPYVRVGYQLKPNLLGVGVIGVIECDFLQPTHNKQDFDYTKAFRACMIGLGRKLNEYWHEKKTPRNKTQQPIVEETEKVIPDQSWVQCDNPKCLKWRMLPDGIDLDSLPEKWYCKDHPLPAWRSCDVPEELEQEQLPKTAYTKEVKREMEKERMKKKHASWTNEIIAVDLLAMAEKNKKDLETEKKRTVDNEAKANQQAAEIRRLTQQLQKGSSPLNVIGSVSLAKQTSTHKAASFTPSSQIMQTPVKLTAAMSRAETLNPRLLSSPVNSPVPARGVTDNNSLTESPTLRLAVIPASVSSKVPTYPTSTRQIINQAIKVRLPTSTRKSFQIISNTSRPPTPGSLVVLNSQSPTMSQSPSTVTISVASLAKSLPSIKPQSIHLTASQMPQILSKTTHLQTSPAGSQKVITVLRLPGTNATRPVAVTAPAVTSHIPLEPRVPVMSSGSFKSTPAPTHQAVSSPSSLQINQQLAQIGIDAIAEQEEQDIKPIVLNAASYRPNILGRKTPGINTNGTSPSAATASPDHSSREHRKQIKKSKRSLEDDDDVVEIIPNKQIKQDPTADHNNSNPVSKKRHRDKENPVKLEPGGGLEIPVEILKSTDNDVIEHIKSLSPESVLGLLAQRSQQLRDLRQSVCQLLGVLVPDLNLPASKMRSLDDNTIDALLKDVLDANTDSAKQ